MGSLFRSAKGTLDRTAFIQCVRQEEENGGKRFDESRFLSRWFCDDGELIQAEGQTFAFSKEWGPGFVPTITKLREAFAEHPIEFAGSEDET